MLGVLLRNRMTGETHESAGPDCTRGRARAHENVGRLMRLDMRARETLGVFVARVARRVLLHRVDSRIEMRAAHRARDETLLRRLQRLLEVVVVDLGDARRHFTARRPCIDPFVLVRRGRLRAKRQLGAMRRRAVYLRRIRENQPMLSALMLDVVVDAFALGDPAQKIEIRLAVLRAVFEARIVRRAFVLEVDVIVAEHLCDDRGHGHPMKKSAVRRAREQPQARAHGRAIHRRAVGLRARGPRQLERRDDAVVLAPAARGNLQRQREVAAEHRRDIEVRAIGEQFEIPLREPPEFLASAHAIEHEGVLAERASHLRDAVGIGEHHRWPPFREFASGASPDRRSSPRRPRCTGRSRRYRATADCRASP
ncbi:hypothetical protein AWB82_06731 [Caballeronia glebae]|uniref:Uncharacterized protein n=1 Tax=Caballeronia glebae TaxID=1777143 RepID=A0A158DH11_9BURK|nr:hypothetical protein AWB82_06731 [Caballeronia glebae]